MTNTTGV